jgi:hypothetical protein
MRRLNKWVIWNDDAKRLELDVPEDVAVHLQRTGFKADPRSAALARAVPARATHVFALHRIFWENTFVSLTNKDPKKIIFYRPEPVFIVTGTLVADMRYANQYLWGDDAGLAPYIESVRPLEEVNLADYHLPELLIP